MPRRPARWRLFGWTPAPARANLSRAMTKAEIQRIIENDFTSLCAAAAGVSGGTLVRDGLYSFTRGSLMEWYDKVFDFRLPVPDGGAFAADLVRRIEKGEIPRSVFLASGPETEALEAPLVRAGFSVFYEQTGMAVRRGELRAPEGGPGEIGPVTTGEDLDAWIACLDLSFERKRNRTQYGKLAGADGISLWGIRDGGVMVSTILLQERGEASGIHLVSTHPDHRKKGHGARLTAFAAGRAFSAGADRVVLLSSPMGRGMYAGLGFAVYGTVKHLRYGGH